MYKRPPIHLLDKCFLDLETSGLLPDSEILELAYIITDKTATTVKLEYSCKVLPTQPVPEEAAAINGYDKLIWELEAVSLAQAMRKLAVDVKDCVFLAHNREFDWRYIMRDLKKVTGYGWPGPWNGGDTMAMAFPLLMSGDIPNQKLESLVNYMGLQQEAAHAALSDCNDCRLLYIRLMEIWNAKPIPVGQLPLISG